LEVLISAHKFLLPRKKKKFREIITRKNKKTNILNVTGSDRVAVSTAMPHRHCEVSDSLHERKLRMSYLLFIFNFLKIWLSFMRYLTPYFQTDRRYQSSPPIWMPFRRLPTRPPTPKVRKYSNDNRKFIDDIRQIPESRHLLKNRDTRRGKWFLRQFVFFCSFFRRSLTKKESTARVT